MCRSVTQGRIFTALFPRAEVSDCERAHHTWGAYLHSTVSDCDRAHHTWGAGRVNGIKGELLSK
eukprot:1186985-Prymnesium_polylepis.1